MKTGASREASVSAGYCPLEDSPGWPVSLEVHQQDDQETAHANRTHGGVKIKMPAEHHVGRSTNRHVAQGLESAGRVFAQSRIHEEPHEQSQESMVGMGRSYILWLPVWLTPHREGVRGQGKAKRGLEPNGRISKAHRWPRHSDRIPHGPAHPHMSFGPFRGLVFSPK